MACVCVSCLPVVLLPQSQDPLPYQVGDFHYCLPSNSTPSEVLTMYLSDTEADGLLRLGTDPQLDPNGGHSKQHLALVFFCLACRFLPERGLASTRMVGC